MLNEGTYLSRMDTLQDVEHQRHGPTEQRKHRGCRRGGLQRLKRIDSFEYAVDLSIASLVCVLGVRRHDPRSDMDVYLRLGYQCEIESKGRAGPHLSVHRL